MKILFVAPHLSTGGCPQYLLKKIKVLNEDNDVYCIEYANYGIYAVQRNQIKEILKEKFFELPENKDELNNIIDKIKPDVVHLEEMPEYFMDDSAKVKLYRKDRPYILIETSHDSSFDPETKTVIPDKLMLVSEYQKNHLRSLDIPSEVHEYPITINPKKSREESLKELGLDPFKKHVINVGLFTPRKNQAEIVEYAKKLTHLPIQFHFIGNQAPNFKNYWEPIMKDFPPNCIWWNERKDVHKFYQAADLFLFTSRGTHTDKETSPLVIREAISYNIPSLIYNLPVYLGMYDKYENIKYLDFDSKENNINTILRLLSLRVEDMDPIIPSNTDLTETTNYTNGNSNFKVSYDKNDNKIHFSSTISYTNLLVSVKELDSEAVVWSSKFDHYPQNSNYWIIPVPKSYIDFETSPAFGGLLVEFYQDSNLLFQEKIRIKSVISKPKLKIKNNTEPVYVNYTEFFVDKIYDEYLGGKKFNVVVDVGANLGVWTEYIQHVSSCKKVYAVEPNIKALKTLKQTYPNNDIVTIVEKAMANKDGEMEFFVDNSNSGISSLSNLGNLTNSYKVKTTTFKTFVKDNNIKYIDLLKIDIETGEYDLISSMDSEDFSRVGSLLIEYHLFDGRTVEKDVKSLSNKLEKFGYKLEMKPMHDGGGYIFANKPMTFNKEDRIESLLKEYRMDYVKDDCNGVNRLHGLYDLIKEKVKENFHIAEVGSYIGRSTELFALNCEKIYSIDPYASYSEIIDEHMNIAESKFLEMAKDYDNITKIKKTSLQAANDFGDRSLDLVYIDGAHDYQNVKNDILAWASKVKINGFICGHDYDYHEIKRAIDEIYPEEKISVYSDFSWAIQIKRKPKEIFIVSAYPDVLKKEELLNDTVTKLKSLGKTVMIASHYAIPSYIVEKVDYYIYDAMNMLNVEHTLDRDGPDYWMETDGFRMEAILSSHVSALTRIFGIALDFAKNLEYDYFIAIESDSIYDINDLKKFDDIKTNVINQNKKLFFFKPKRTEFNWFDSRVYETYSFGGFIDEFNKKLKLPTNYSEWNKLYHEDTKINCLEYLIYKKFKDDEKDYLILGTLKSYLVNSKIDLFSVGDPVGVYYNSKNETQPLVFLTNNSNKSVTYNLVISDGALLRTITLTPGQWWMYAIDISKYNVDVCIWSEEEGKANKKYRQTLDINFVKKLKNYKIIKFK
jgi:FkbM family methyltransferase